MHLWQSCMNTYLGHMNTHLSGNIENQSISQVILTWVCWTILWGFKLFAMNGFKFLKILHRIYNLLMTPSNCSDSGMPSTTLCVGNVDKKFIQCQSGRPSATMLKWAIQSGVGVLVSLMFIWIYNEGGNSG